MTYTSDIVKEEETPNETTRVYYTWERRTDGDRKMLRCEARLVVNDRFIRKASALYVWSGTRWMPFQVENPVNTSVWPAIPEIFRP